MRLLSTWLILSLAPLLAQESSIPVGRSERVMEGLQTTLIVPQGLTPERRGSLVLLLHGLGDTGANLSHTLQSWTREGYVICAPTAKGKQWSRPQVESVIRIGKRLLELLPIDPEKIHTMGFSNGGWNLPTLAFSDELKPVSAIYLAAGHDGPSPPKWAKKRLSVLALAGEQDPNARAARATVTRLRGKVLRVEARFQPNLGQKWPRMYEPFMLWWTGVTEGRFTPGDDMNFDWQSDFTAALATQASRKKRGGVWLYVYDAEGDKDSKEARRIQEVVFMHPLVRHFGNQLPAVKMDRNSADLPAGLKINKTPAVAIYDRKGKLKKLYEGKIKVRQLAASLRKRAPDPKMPKLK